MQTKTKGKLPLKGDDEWRKHRNKQESRHYWSIEREAAKKDIRIQLKEF